MKSILATLLPSRADNTLSGSKLPLYVFIFVAVIGTVRSLIHVFAPDGGARSIAGMDLSVACARGIIFAFALWGSAQLIYAVIQWLVILRYRSLVPFMWTVQFLESLLRVLVGHMKPVTFAHTPPGAFQNWVYLPLALVMLAVCLCSARKPRSTAGA